MIMIDCSVKHNRKFGFKLQSLHVIEKHYKLKQNHTKIACVNSCFIQCHKEVLYSRVPVT